MIDSITNCIVYKNLDGSVYSYDVTFSFGGVTVPSMYNPVRVMGYDLVNSNDLIEVKKVACQRASTIKVWCSTVAIITDLNGEVIL